MANIVLSKKDYLILNVPQKSDIRLRVAQVKLQYSGFAVFTATKIINEEIIDTIQRKMEAAGISKKIVERTYLLSKAVSFGARGRAIEFYVKSDYVSEKGFPVAVMIERGRKQYDITAKKNRPNPHLKFLGEDGSPVFRRKVKIPRKPAGRFISDTIKEKRKVCQERLNTETVKWINHIMRR